MMPTMVDGRIEAAALELVSARQERRQIEQLPEFCRPKNDEDALAIQKRIVELLNDTIGGWKVSLPRGEHVFLAPLPASTISSGSRYTFVPNTGIARIEPEVAFFIGRDLRPQSADYSENDVRGAIKEARLILEIIGSRIEDPNAAPFVEFLADSLNNQGLLVGPAVPNIFERQLETMTITAASATQTLITHNGKHPNGHPLRPLIWLVNFLSSRGDTLKEGSIVTTGSYAGILEVPFDTPLSISYGDLGKLDVTFEGVLR